MRMIWHCEATSTNSCNSNPEGKSQFMVDMIHLALVTNSTRAGGPMTFGIIGEKQL